MGPPSWQERMTHGRVIYFPSAVEGVDFPCLLLQVTDDDDATLPGDSPRTCEDRHTFHKFLHVHTIGSLKCSRS